MPTIQIAVQRHSVVSSRPFESVVARLTVSIGHPDMVAFPRDMAAARNFEELERVVHRAVGASGLMEFARFDIGEVLRKESGADSPRILRLVIGNPLIMKQMAVHVPDAASYAPVTVLIDERADGVHVSYDRMAGYLAPYGNAEALKVAQELDAKIEALLSAAAL
jgi:uncharacterized protein (DUF302 family)